jgi:hypothetical protein
MKTQTPEQVVATAMASHPRSKDLVRSGKIPDQLLRSLIPLYVAAKMPVDLNSGQIVRVWKKFKVRYAAPNAAKALRENAGFAKRTAGGRRITRSGVRYVEAALKELA